MNTGNRAFHPLLTGSSTQMFSKIMNEFMQAFEVQFDFYVALNRRLIIKDNPKDLDAKQWASLLELMDGGFQQPRFAGHNGSSSRGDHHQFKPKTIQLGENRCKNIIHLARLMSDEMLDKAEKLIKDGYTQNSRVWTPHTPAPRLNDRRLQSARSQAR